MNITKNLVIDDQNKIVMENRDYTIKDREFMKILHETYPQGVEYANKAMNKALELSEVSYGFYQGSLLSDYGIYPFLTAHSAEYEEDGLFSMQIIFHSKMDKEMLEKWINDLSLSKDEKKMIISDVRRYYNLSDGNKVDVCYVEVLNYLIQMLKCFKERYETRRVYMDSLFDLSVNYSHVVTLNSVITKDYLQRRIARYNQKKGKKTGKFFVMNSYPDIEKSACIVSCVKYRV